MKNIVSLLVLIISEIFLAAILLLIYWFFYIFYLLSTSKLGIVMIAAPVVFIYIFILLTKSFYRNYRGVGKSVPENIIQKPLLERNVNILKQIMVLLVLLVILGGIITFILFLESFVH
jgi:hypothetical protein